MPRMACAAPMLMRRVKGVVGAVRASSSSTAFSSIESEFVDKLALRMNEAEALFGDVPDRPRVVMESLRRCSLMAAVESEPGKGATGFCELLRKRLVRAAEVTDPRRCGRAISLGEVLLEIPAPLVLSEDMMGEKTRRTSWELGGLIGSLNRSPKTDSTSNRDACRDLDRGGFERAGLVVGTDGQGGASYVYSVKMGRDGRAGATVGRSGVETQRAKSNDDCSAKLQSDIGLFFVRPMGSTSALNDEPRQV
jgi:hypothetical protein